ncbi:MBL fold metallo-hydrolase [Oxalobacteraceae bacterium OM1]|nr:MBL fold metallo-hydrolase [Oxalobacteraceae bacterium OM1]
MFRRRLCLLAAAALIAAPGFADSLDAYRDRLLPSASQAATTTGLRVTYLGVTTLLFDDGETAIMTDGFFSRPDLKATPRIAPDEKRIRAGLQRANVKSLAAVIPLHSHLDHAMDAPAVAEMTGAVLAGSSSTANIGLGYGMDASRLRIVPDGATLRFGRFKVTFIPTKHYPMDFALGDITEPLRPPADPRAYKQGTCYTLLIEHDGRTILVQASAGFVPGALAGRKVDVAYLGIGGLGQKPRDYQDAYWHEMMQVTGARRAIGIHWDDFSAHAHDAGEPQDGFEASMRSALEHAARDGVDMRVPRAWVAADPFEGLR